MNDGIHVQLPNAYETREDLVSHSAVPYTSIQPPYQYHKEKKKFFVAYENYFRMETNLSNHFER